MELFSSWDALVQVYVSLKVPSMQHRKGLKTHSNTNSALLQQFGKPLYNTQKSYEWILWPYHTIAVHRVALQLGSSLASFCCCCSHTDLSRGHWQQMGPALCRSILCCRWKELGIHVRRSREESPEHPRILASQNPTADTLKSIVSARKNKVKPTLVNNDAVLFI